MLTQILWWGGIALSSLLLIRAVSGRFFRRYVLFYLYLSYVFLVSLLAFFVYTFEPGSYPSFYWWTEILSVGVGCGVIWEIFRQALSQYPGAARMAKHALWAILVAVMSKAFLNALTSPVWSRARTTAELERNLRSVQAILLVAIVGVLAYYAIPAGRNLKGMILGYGFFIGARLISLTLRSYLGDPFQPWWQHLPAIIYWVTLLIWCSMWSYQPNLQPELDVGMEGDYELVAARMSRPS